jgi:hypothetical protein
MATTETPVTTIVAETMRTLTETPAVNKDVAKTLTTTAATAVVVVTGFYAHSKLMPKVKDMIARHRSTEVIVEGPVTPATDIPAKKKA